MGVKVTPAFSVEAENRAGLSRRHVRTGKHAASSVGAPRPAVGAVPIRTRTLYLTPPDPCEFPTPLGPTP